MSQTRQATIVGLFIIGAMALVVVAVLMFSGPSLFAQPIRVVTFFQGSVAGLEAGAPVTFRGVRVGSVARVAILVSPSEREPTIPVYLELVPGQLIASGGVLGGVSADDVAPLVEQGLRAQLAAQSLITGQMRVELDFQPSTPEVYVGADPHVPEIPAVRSRLEVIQDQLSALDLQGLTETAQQALTAIESLAATLEREVDGLTAGLDGIVVAADGLIGTADRVVVGMDETVVEIRRELAETLAAFRSLATTTEGQVAARGAEIAGLVGTLEGAARSVSGAAADLDALLDPRSGLRIDLDATLRDLAVAASGLRSFALQLERNPSAIITGR